MKKALIISMAIMSLTMLHINALAGNTTTLERGSGYYPCDVEDYPELSDIWSYSRSTQPFASFDEKTAEFRNEDFEYVKTDQDNIFVTCREYDNGVNRVILTHIIIRDPSQMKIGLSNDQFGGERELCTSYADRTGAAVVINGSYFYYGTGQPIDLCAPVVLNGGNILRGGSTNGSEVCLRFDGTFFSPHPLMAFTDQDLLNLGVISNFGTADPLLIQDGTPMSFPDGTNDYSYNRTAIGVVAPCEYYIITAGADSSYGMGLTYRQMQTIFYNLNCTYARSLDGGGSATLVVNGDLMSMPAEGKERAVVDFLAFFN